jgi:broad specificity phosphatase PhoE
VRLTLVRHGQTDHNRGGITLGRADAPLNARGQLQARAIAASFLRPPDTIYSSPLARCRETAEAIARHTGVAITIDDALIEMDVGEMEHLSREELRAKYPDFLRSWLSGEGADARMPGGETLREVQARALVAVERMRAEQGGRAVVAVAHNFVIRMLLCDALNLPPGEFRRLQHSVGAISRIEYGEPAKEGGGTIVTRLNDVTHLAAAGLADDL